MADENNSNNKKNTNTKETDPVQSGVSGSDREGQKGNDGSGAGTSCGCHNLLKNRRVWLFLIDAVCFLGTFILCVSFSAWNTWNPTVEKVVGTVISYWPCALVQLICVMGSRLIARVYLNIWRYPNISAYRDMMVSDFCSGIVSYLITRFGLYGRVEGGHLGLLMTISIFAIFAMVTLMGRFAYQLSCRVGGVRRVFSSGKHQQDQDGLIRVGIVGAGQLGALLADNMRQDKTSRRVPVCFFEKNTEKVGSRVADLPVFSEDDAEKQIRRLNIEEIVLTPTGLTADALDKLCEKYAVPGCVVKMHGETAPLGMVRHLTERDYTALLGRPSLLAEGEELQRMQDYYRGQVVLVTGGGGSIGSELCRQLAACQPKQIIIFDIYENNAYEVQMELTKKYGQALNLAVEIGSVRDVDRLSAVFNRYRPDVVFHAAAHKHVPLMEHSNCEAIKNNVFGTYNTANMAEKYGVKRFVLISTDKAVNPTNVMGASKRMCEMVIQCRRDSATVFTAVRFGNVLGSHGSVIPLFQEQIQSGGPVTVTSKDIVRYFMTIPEASQLVMQAGALAERGELYVLNMGNPVKIWSLAERLIWMMGKVPGRDIDIQEIGLRPGEKEYEETLYKGQEAEKKEKISVARETAPTRREVEEKLAILRQAVEQSKDELESVVIRNAMKAVVPTFKEADEVNKHAKETAEMKDAVNLPGGRGRARAITSDDAGRPEGALEKQAAGRA